ncbi:MAG: cell division ATP-binding protein FtsE [Gemmatimonadota bacterium]|nr:cell division ATP-binding protein FtsE [Gemmatimonadota bacterium]
MIKFRDVSKTYPNGAMALRQVTFHVPRGEFVFLTGHSGAGKSSILSLITGAQHPTSGEVRVSGYSIGGLSGRDVPKLRRRLGVVFQDFRLLAHRTAEENVAFALEVTGARAETIPNKAMKVLTRVGLASKARSYPRELSGGEQQRVAIARALVNDPPILLADEPTGNLDERATRGVFQLLQEINAGGTVVLLATHDLELIRHAGYRTLELRGGELVYDSAEEPAGSPG